MCDTGCQGDGVISPDLIKFLDLESKVEPDNTKITLADGSSSTSGGKIEVSVEIGDIVKTLSLTVFPIASTFILGIEALTKIDILDNFREKIRKLNKITEKN